MMTYTGCTHVLKLCHRIQLMTQTLNFLIKMFKKCKKVILP